MKERQPIPTLEHRWPIHNEWTHWRVDLWMLAVSHWFGTSQDLLLPQESAKEQGLRGR